MDLALNRAELTALLLESLVYGIFLVLFVILLIITFLSKKRAIMSKKYIVPTGTLMMLVATTHLVVDFLRALEAFVPTDLQRTPDQFFKRLAHPFAVLNWALYALQTILGDSILVWRCYMLCDKKWWTIVPGVLLISFNVVNWIIVTRALTLSVGAEFIILTRPWLSSWIITTAVVQLCYSVAIVAQMWRKFKQGSRAVITIIVESCAIYTLFATALLIAYEEASDLDWILLDVITPLVGVSFCLIIIQIHIHFQREDSTNGLTSDWSPRNRSTGIAISSFHGSEPDVVAVVIPDPKSLGKPSLQSLRDVQV